MQLARTTVRLHPQIKKAAEMKALELDMTFQAFLEKAIEIALRQESHRSALKLVFKDRNMGVALDQLDREDIYVD